MRSLVSALRVVLVLALGALVVGCEITSSATRPQSQTRPAERNVVLTISPQDGMGPGGGPRALESRAATESLPTRMMVYRVKPADVSRASFESQARRLGFAGKAQELPASFVIADSNASFEVDRATGSFDYTTKGFEKQAQPLKRFLSDEQYRERAETFLNDMDLMPEAAEFRDVNRGNVVSTYENGAWVARPYMVEARFSHKPLAGFAFDKGVGPKVIVQFGEDGRILGAMSVWRNIEPFAEYALKTPEQALDAARNGRAQFFGLDGQSGGTVESISMSYMNDPLGYDQLYVLPFYLLEGSSEDGRGFTGITYAIPDEMLKVESSLVTGPPMSASTTRVTWRVRCVVPWGTPPHTYVSTYQRPSPRVVKCTHVGCESIHSVVAGQMILALAAISVRLVRCQPSK